MKKTIYLRILFVLTLGGLVSCDKDTPIEEVVVSRQKEELIVGQYKHIEIIVGTGRYEVSSNNPKVASVSLSDTNVRIRANSKGIAEIKVKDVFSKQVRIINLTVFEKLSLSIDSLRLRENEYGHFTVTTGSGFYSISSNNTRVARIKYFPTDAVVRVDGKTKGRTTIVVTDLMTRQTVTLYVMVTADK